MQHYVPVSLWCPHFSIYILISQSNDLKLFFVSWSFWHFILGLFVELSRRIPLHPPFSTSSLSLPLILIALYLLDRFYFGLSPGLSPISSVQQNTGMGFPSLVAFPQFHPKYSNYFGVFPNFI